MLKLKYLDQIKTKVHYFSSSNFNLFFCFFFFLLNKRFLSWTFATYPATKLDSLSSLSSYENLIPKPSLIIASSPRSSPPCSGGKSLKHQTGGEKHTLSTLYMKLRVSKCVEEQTQSKAALAVWVEAPDSFLHIWASSAQMGDKKKENKNI